MVVGIIWLSQHRHLNIIERRLQGVDSTPHALLGFASSGVHSHSLLFFWPFLHVGQITPVFGRALLFSNSLFFLASCARLALLLFFVSSRSVYDKLHGHNVLASMPHFVSTSSLRVRLLRFLLTSISHPARRQQRLRFLWGAHAAAIRCCRSASADLPALQLSGVRLHTRARLLYFCSARVRVPQRLSDTVQFSHGQHPFRLVRG